jgi:hypothetical protein
MLGRQADLGGEVVHVRMVAKLAEDIVENTHSVLHAPWMSGAL